MQKVALSHLTMASYSRSEAELLVAKQRIQLQVRTPRSGTGKEHLKTNIIAIASSDTCGGSEVLAQQETECWKVLLYPLFY